MISVPGLSVPLEHHRTPNRKRNCCVRNGGHVLECGSVLPLLSALSHYCLVLAIAALESDLRLIQAREPICQRSLPPLVYFKAREIRKAACSRKLRSAFVNAFNLSLSTSIKPTTFSASVMTGTTISDWVLQNVGK